MQGMQIIKNYRDNASLRRSFNELAGKTFGLDFEDWYQNGYWGENYNPYSVVLDGQVVANVSVNRTDFLWNGKPEHFIQLGTVMTDVSYRNRGFIRQLMQEIETDYEEQADGIYLFANDSVLDFYPKFGFRKEREFRYGRAVFDGVSDGVGIMSGKADMVQAPMRDKAAWDMLERAIRESVPYANPELVGNPELILFYVTKFMQENVYYDKNYDMYVIAEMEEGKLLVHNIFSKQQRSLNEVISAFGRDIKEVTFGFTPVDTEGFAVTERKEEDTTLFVKGKGFEKFAEQGVMLPTLAHA